MLGKRNDGYDSRFEFDEPNVEATVSSRRVGEPTTDEKPVKKVKKGKKRFGFGKAISALALCGALGVGAYFGTGAFVGYGPFRNLTESGRVNSLVAEYTNDDLFCSLPENMLIDKAYDIMYASGEKFVDSLKSHNVKYCEVLDEFYTPNGEDIAILTYDIATRDVVPAIEVKFNGAIVYMPVEGYTLDGAMCYKEGTEQLVKVVPVSPTGDYSDILLDSSLSDTETILSANLESVREVSTKTYDEILDMTLICDVADGAVLDQNNQCLSSFNLVPKNYNYR